MPRTLPILAALCAALTLAACGGDAKSSASGSSTGSGSGSSTTASIQGGSINGAGATFPQPVYQEWGAELQGTSQITVNYQGVGSGAGIEQFTAGTVDFGASDAVMKPAEQQAAEARGGPVLHLPWAAGAIAVLYNLSGIEGLQLSPATLAAIFAGTVTRWDDPRIAGDNPGLRLPNRAVQVVHRSDGSGTTEVFTSYLTAVAPDVWKAGSGKDVPWPTGQGAKGSDGVSVAVKQAEGGIGYAELSFAVAQNITVARIGNAAGRFAAPTPEAVTAALEEAEIPPDLRVKVTYTPKAPAAYPISTTTWALMYAKPSDPGKAALLRAFALYALGPGQAQAGRLSYAPLPHELSVRAQAALYEASD